MAFTTRKSLLARVREGDEISWNDFYSTYKPLIILCGNDCSLTPDENDELVQTVMTEIFRKDILSKYDLDHVPENVVFKYDPCKGRFRYFLKKIIRNQAIRIYRRRLNHESLEEIAEPADDKNWDCAWDEEWRKHLMNMALVELKTRIQPDTYVEFEMYVLQERPAEEVAKFFNVSVSAVYTAKCRCIVHLKEIIGELEKED